MHEYSGDDIVQRSFRDSVRLRPGMWIGGIGNQGVLHMTLEIVANCFDQALLGRASRIAVTLHADGSIEVIDDGPGVNLEDEQVYGWFSEGHREPTADGHHPHTHLNSWGVGVGVVNFLSRKMVVNTRRPTVL